MNKKQFPLKVLKENVLSDFAICLSKHGFYQIEQQFERRTSDVVHIIHLMFIENKGSQTLAVVVNIAVRHERIEGLANSWRSDLKEKDKRRIATIGTELGKIIDRPHMRWEISSLEDSLKVAESICRAVESHGFPYLEHYSNVRNIQKCLSSDNWRDWQGQLPGGRALRLPLVCALLGQTDTTRCTFVTQYDKIY